MNVLHRWLYGHRGNAFRCSREYPGHTHTHNISQTTDNQHGNLWKMFIFRKNRQQIILCSAKNTQRERERGWEREKEKYAVVIIMIVYLDVQILNNHFIQYYLRLDWKSLRRKKSAAHLNLEAHRFNQLFEVCAIVRYGCVDFAPICLLSTSKLRKLTRIFAWKWFHSKTSG